MLQNTPRCQEMPHNLQWTFKNPQECLTYSCDIIWHFWTIRSFSKQLSTHENASDCLSTPQNLRERIRHPGFCQNHENKSKCLRKFSYIREHLKTFGNPLELLRAYENASEHVGMSENVSKSKRMINIDLIRINENDAERNRTPQTNQEHQRTPQNT